MGTLTIRLERLTLRPFRWGDEDSLVVNINNEKIARATEIPYPYNKEHALAWIEDTRKAGKKKIRTEIHFALDRSGEVIGGIGLRKIDGREAEIGYWLGERYWSQGIMTSAVEAVTTYAFVDLGLERVYACVFPDNRASARVLEKAGYKFEIRLKQHVARERRRRDCLLFAKVR